MKLPRKKRDETSATITSSLMLIVVCFGLFVLAAYAADPASWNDPSWWYTDSGPTNAPSAVIPPQVVTNGMVVTTNYFTNNYAVVTQGQLKQFTARAVDTLNSEFTDGAGTNLTNLVYGWEQDYLTNGYATNMANPTRPYKPSDFQAENVGQLKYIGNLVWDQLVTNGYTNEVPSWLAQNTNTDHALANLGQLKEVFNFDPAGSQALPDLWLLEYFGETNESPTNDFDGNGFNLLQDYLGGANPTNYYSRPGSGLVTPTLTIVGGNNQVIPQGAFASQPLQVQVTDTNNDPLVNAPVTFTVTSGGGQLATNDAGTPELGTSLLVTADSSGLAQAYFQQASTNDQINATTGGQTVTFNETNATWWTLFSSEVQTEITMHQWNQTQANNYVALENNNPTMLTHGLMLWLEAGSNVTASNGSVPTNNGSVASWADQTGNYTLSQTTTTNQPTYVVSDVNGLAALHFNGSQRLYNSSNLGLDADMTIITFGMSTSTNTRSYPLYLGQNNGTAGINRAVGYSSTNDEFFDTGGSASATGPAAPASGTFLTEMTSLDSTLTNVTFYQYGVLTTSNGILTDTNTVSGVQNLSAGITVGAGGGGTNDWQGDIAEVLVYDHKLSSTELTHVDGYLADKYGYYDTNATWPEAYSSTNQSLIASNHWTESQANAYVAGLATTPTNSLVVWLRADAGITTTNNGTTTNAVCEWADQSSSGTNSATQSSSSNQPTLVADAINGMPALLFNGTNSYLSIPDDSSLRPSTITILAVANRLGNPASGGTGYTGYCHILGKPYSDSSNSWPYPYFSYELSQDSPSPDPFVQIAVSDSNKKDEISVPVDTNQPYLFSAVYDGTNINFRQDGSSPSTLSVSGSVDNHDATALVIGQASVNNPHEFFNGQIAEILIYNTNLTDTEREQAEIYLADKYGLYDPNATWLSSYSSEVQALITANQWNQSQADAYVVLATNPSIPAAGLALWLKADAGVSQTSGSVTTWVDQSPFHNDVSGGNSPQFVGNALNGEPGISFIGNTDWAGQYLIRDGYTGLATGGHDRTLLCVVRYDNNFGTYMGGFSYGTASSTEDTFFGVDNNGYPFLGDWGNGVSFGTNSIVGQGYVIQEEELNTDGSVSAYLNGSLISNDPSPPTYDTTTDGYLVIGADLNGNSATQTICEILAYNRELTSTELTQADGYLADKYGLNDPNATWPCAFSSAVQSLISDNNWNEEQANAYVALTELNPLFTTDGLVLWLKADAGVDAASGVTATNTDSVGTWQDQSTYGNNAAQNAFCSPPTFLSTGLNGHPCLQFNGSNILAISDNASLRPSYYTIMAVAQENSTSNYYQTILARPYNTDTTNWDAPYISYDVDLYGATANSYLRSAVTTDGSPTVYASTPGTAYDTSAPHEFTWKYDGSDQYGYADGSLLYQNTGGGGSGPLDYSATNSGTTSVCLGNVTDFTVDHFESLYGNLAEVLVFNGALSDTDRQQVEVYLADKYGLYNPDATWMEGYSTEVQVKIALHQWNEAQANNYVTLENNNPTMLTHGLSLWLRADAGVTTTNSDKVMTLADQTGNYTLSQTATTNQPTLVSVTNGITSFPALQFTSNQWLASAGTLAPGLNQDMTIITVGMTTSSNAEEFALYLGQNASDGANRDLNHNGGSEYFDVGGYYSSGGSAPEAGTNVIEAAELNSTTNLVTFYQNGLQTMTNTISGVTTLSPDITMGAATGGSSGWQGNIMEQLVYDHQLSSSELNEVGVYLANKYSIPYNGDAPTISPAAGSYTNTQTVTISSSLGIGTLCYTLDGTLPTASSPAYTGPFSLPVSADVQAAVFSAAGVQISQFATPDQITIGGSNLAPAPTSLQAIPVSPSEINLSWDLSSLLTYSQVNVYRSTNGSTNELLVELSPTTTGYADTSVTGTNSYTYTVGTYNQAGVNEITTTNSVSPLAPATLTIIVTTPSGAVNLP